MFDLFAAIQEVEPTAIPLVAILASSAAMYLIGILLPCSACCVPPCSTCTEGELPDTITVTLDGYADQDPGPFLCSLAFAACFGGGAAGRVTTPGGDPVLDKGPITAVELTNAGSGYAKLGRLAPTLTLSGGSGTGATLTPTVTSDDDACGIPFWQIASVAVSGGTGYLDGDAVTITAGAGDTTEIVAAATIHTTRSVPSLTPSISPGTGATFTISYTPDGPPATWYIIGIEVTDGGTGYVDNDSLTLSLGSGDHEGYAADAIVWTNRLEPTLAASVVSPTGSGAALAVTLATTTDWDSRDLWEVSGLSITSGGIDYEVGDPIQITPTDGQEWAYSYFSAEVSAVDGAGTITGVVLSYGGGFFKNGGVIQSVQIYNGGSYWHDDGIPTSVSVEQPGKYYLEDQDEEPYVADVTVTIDQTLPSAGAGAVLTATVEDDTASANFGKITAVAIADAGDDYLAWRWVSNDCCGHYLNGRTVVLRRDGVESVSSVDGGQVRVGGHFIPAACVYSHRMCGGWHDPFTVGPGWNRQVEYFSHRILVGYRGPALSPVASVERALEFTDEATRDSACHAYFGADTLIANCGDFAFEGTGSNGKTISVSAGGDYDAQDGFPGGSMAGCSACCQGADVPPAEITVNLQDLRPGAMPDLSGDHVLAKVNGNFQLWFLTVAGIQVRVWMDAEFCARHPDAGGCDHCIKKCAVFGAVFTGGAFGGWDTRLCDLDEAQQCEAACLDTPMCAPPAGVEITLSHTDPCGDPDFIITT